MLLLCHTNSIDGDVTNQHGALDIWLVKLDDHRNHNHREAGPNSLSDNFLVNIYPNPASKSLILQLPSTEESTIQIVNHFGQIVFTEKVYSSVEGS